MLRYLTSRLVQGFVVIVGAIVISFLLVNLTGNPADVLGGGYLPPEARRELARDLGYGEPALTRLGDYVVGASHADFGVSIRTGEPAAGAVLEALPNTVILVACAMALALAVAVPVSLLSVLRRESRLDRNVRTALLLLGSLPDFWVALVLVLVVSVHLRLLPSVGFTGPESLVVPASALALPLIPALVRVLRGTLLDVGELDFVTGLRAKGYSDRYIVVRHGLPNAMVPFVTLVALQIGSLLGGTLIVEVVFGWPGIGTLLADAVAVRDIALVQATVVIVAFAYVVLNLAADLIVAWIDPRVRVAAR
jgi:peptide/nickel transport system permease protein